MSRTYTKEELKEILDNHKKWVRGVVGGTRANLYGADLTQANLYGASLCGANLYGADLTRANLYGADLTQASLCGANLYGASLCEANLYGADLTRANLYRADLTQASLCGANLYGADLTRANLYGADLTRASLCGANLYGADLTRANLYGADLTQASLCGANLEKTTGFNRAVLPEEGEFIAYKKVESANGKRVLVLHVPEYAGRVTPYSDRKSRVSHATPIRAEMLDGSPASETKFSSMHDPEFVYELGKEAHVPDYVDSKFEVCTRGIHLYISRKEAQEHE